MPSIKAEELRTLQEIAKQHAALTNRLPSAESVTIILEIVEELIDHPHKDNAIHIQTFLNNLPTRSR